MKQILFLVFLPIVVCFLSCADTSKDSDSSPRINAYARSAWPTVHADGRNSDVISYDGATDLTLAYQVLVGRAIGSTPTLSSDGQMYLSVGGSTESAETDPDCHLFAMDEATGEILWCSKGVNDNAITSSPLIDVDGNIYLGDNQAMVSFTFRGDVRWKTEILGFPISAQFTPDGHLIFITQIGRIYVLRRDSGEFVLPVVEMLPGIGYTPTPQDYDDCLSGSTEGTCYVANALSMDPETGRFYFTLNMPDNPEAKLVSMQYSGGIFPEISERWENKALSGGSASSPVISADGSRLYVADQANHVLALDAQNGGVLWSIELGFSPQGSLSVSNDGYIIPTGGAGAVTMVLRDTGEDAAVIWEKADIVPLSIGPQTGNGLFYIAGNRVGGIPRLENFTFDISTGDILDAELFPGGLITVGTGVSRSGLVFHVTPYNGLVAFKPVSEQ